MIVINPGQLGRCPYGIEVTADFVDEAELLGLETRVCESLEDLFRRNFQAVAALRNDGAQEGLFEEFNLAEERPLCAAGQLGGAGADVPFVRQRRREEAGSHADAADDGGGLGVDEIGAHRHHVAAAGDELACGDDYRLLFAQVGGSQK